MFHSLERAWPVHLDLGGDRTVKLPKRRDFIRVFSMGTWAAVLGACAQPAPPAPTQAAKPAGQATTAPAAAAPPAQQQQAPATTGGTITLKMHSGFGAKDILHEQLVFWGQKVDQMTAGRVKIDVLNAGAVVGPFQMIDAVHQGVVDGALGVPAYWFGKNKAFSLFGTGPSLGMDAEMVLGWMYYGGGNAFYDELLQNVLKLNVVSHFGGPMPSQPLGWFRNEIKSVDDFKGLKYRTVGMAQDLFGNLGASVQAIGGADVVPSLERGVIEGAEFNNPTSDRALGLPDVRKTYMAGSYHQQTEFLEWLYNKPKYDGLPKDVQAILKYATMAQSADFTWMMLDRNSKDLAEMKSAQGVKVVRTPQAVLEAQLQAWDTIIENESKDAFFKKVLDSQRAWASRTVQLKTELLTDPVSSLAAKRWLKM